MDDFERYGDYNEVDVAPKKKNPVLRFIKIIVLVLIFAIIGFLIFRIITINYYPDSMESLHFSNDLKAHYEERDGNIKILTQKLKAPYDDEKEGNFFCDNLLVCREAGTLQITLRYNTSLTEEFERNYGCKVDMENKTLFDFTLWRHDKVDGKAEDGWSQAGTLVYEEWDSFLMYRYVKLVFEDVDFEALHAKGEGGEDISRWLFLDVHVDGVKYKDSKTKQWVDKEFKILVYDNLEQWYHFEEYELSDDEVPV